MSENLENVIKAGNSMKNFYERHIYDINDINIKPTTVTHIIKLLSENEVMSELEIMKGFPMVCELGLRNMQNIIIELLNSLCDDGTLNKTVVDNYNYYRLKD